MTKLQPCTHAAIGAWSLKFLWSLEVFFIRVHPCLSVVKFFNSMVSKNAQKCLGRVCLRHRIGRQVSRFVCACCRCRSCPGSVRLATHRRHYPQWSATILLGRCER